MESKGVSWSKNLGSYQPQTGEFTGFLVAINSTSTLPRQGTNERSSKKTGKPLTNHTKVPLHPARPAPCDLSSAGVKYWPPKKLERKQVRQTGPKHYPLEVRKIIHHNNIPFFTWGMFQRFPSLGPANWWQLLQVKTQTMRWKSHLGDEMISPGWTRNVDKPWHFGSKNGLENHFSPTSKKHQTHNLQHWMWPSLKEICRKNGGEKKRRFWGRKPNHFVLFSEA